MAAVRPAETIAPPSMGRGRWTHAAADAPSLASGWRMQHSWPARDFPILHRCVASSLSRRRVPPRRSNLLDVIRTLATARSLSDQSTLLDCRLLTELLTAD